MRQPLIILGCLMALTSPLAQAQQSIEIQDAVMRALNSPSGRYEGPLTGATVAALRQKFNTAAPFFIRVKTIHEFKQAGCRRLETHLFAPDSSVKLKDGTSAPFEFTFQMNLCPDGKPPKDEVYVQPAGSTQVSVDDWAKAQLKNKSATPEQK